MVCFSPLSWALLVLGRKRMKKRKVEVSRDSRYGTYTYGNSMYEILVWNFSMEILINSSLFKVVLREVRILPLYVFCLV